PDGRTYLFMAQGAGGGAEDPAAAAAAGGPGIYTMADDGSRVTRLNTTPTDAAAGGRGRGGRGGGGGGFGGGAEPQWARDGRGIYYAVGGSIYNLAINAPAADTAAAAPAANGGGGGGRGGRGGNAGAAPTVTQAAGGGGPRRITATVRMEIDMAAE